MSENIQPHIHGMMVACELQRSALHSCLPLPYYVYITSCTCLVHHIAQILGVPGLLAQNWIRFHEGLLANATSFIIRQSQSGFRDIFHMEKTYLVDTFPLLSVCTENSENLPEFVVYLGMRLESSLDIQMYGGFWMSLPACICVHTQCCRDDK